MAKSSETTFQILWGTSREIYFARNSTVQKLVRIEKYMSQFSCEGVICIGSDSKM